MRIARTEPYEELIWIQMRRSGRGPVHSLLTTLQCSAVFGLPAPLVCTSAFCPTHLRPSACTLPAVRLACRCMAPSSSCPRDFACSSPSRRACSSATRCAWSASCCWSPASRVAPSLAAWHWRVPSASQEAGCTVHRVGSGCKGCGQRLCRGHRQRLQRWAGGVHRWWAEGARVCRWPHV